MVRAQRGHVRLRAAGRRGRSADPRAFRPASRGADGSGSPACSPAGWRRTSGCRRHSRWRSTSTPGDACGRAASMPPRLRASWPARCFARARSRSVPSSHSLPRVRIVAGEHRGARIYAPKGDATRPTSDRVREAAFNLIGPVDGASVLDLFAGSGAMGLEALSRGASTATFVESDRDAVPDDRPERREAARDRCHRRPARRVPGARRRPPQLRPGSLRPAVRLRPGLEDRPATSPVPWPPTACSSTRPSRREPALDGLRIRTSRTYGSARLTLFEH